MNRLMILLGAVLVLTVTLKTTAQSPGNVSDGKHIFRFDTFGDEQLWTDTLRMPTALATVSPATALSVGLKVDADALPAEIVHAIKAGQVDLNSPAVTLQLLRLNAVVGVVGRLNDSGQLESVGITCALCHSAVDNWVMTGIGRRLDGWPNRTLNVGAIIALSPVLTEEQRAVFNSWGPGKYDARFQAFDGHKLVPLNSTSFPVVIPPAYGLQDVHFETFTADGPISYWNNYVGVSQMGGHGTFVDPRLKLTIDQQPDVVVPKLPALLEYQLSLPAPRPPAGSFDHHAASRGQAVFNGRARCSTCHIPPTFTDVMRGHHDIPFLHSPAETGMEPVYASRSVTGRYRTTPLRGIWQHPPYFHSGSAADLAAVVEHYNTVLSLGLTAGEKADLVEYLKSL